MLMRWTTHLKGLERRLHDMIETAIRRQELSPNSTLKRDLSRIGRDLREQIKVTQIKGTNYYKLATTTKNDNLLGLLGVFEQDQYREEHGDFCDDDCPNEDCTCDH
jgi:hypothetical protein